MKNTTRSAEQQHVATAVHALRMLHALGDDKEQIQQALTMAGFRGCTPSTSSCIIANYLMQSGLQAAHVDVLGDKIVLGFNDDDPDDAEVINTPWPVEEFIDAFDKGAYPWLVQPTAGQVMAGLAGKVLARFAVELAEADDLQLVHLAQRAEARYASGLGRQMRDLVDEERARRVFTAALTAGPA